MPLYSRNSTDNRFDFPYFFWANENKIIIEPERITQQGNTIK